jgi:hypothetical protein
VLALPRFARRAVLTEETKNAIGGDGKTHFVMIDKSVKGDTAIVVRSQGC